jgi:hypothetical protein
LSPLRLAVRGPPPSGSKSFPQPRLIPAGVKHPVPPAGLPGACSKHNRAGITLKYND